MTDKELAQMEAEQKLQIAIDCVTNIRKDMDACGDKLDNSKFRPVFSAMRKLDSSVWKYIKGDMYNKAAKPIKDAIGDERIYGDLRTMLLVANKKIDMGINTRKRQSSSGKISGTRVRA